jgi:hypothetical protein
MAAKLVNVGLFLSKSPSMLTFKFHIGNLLLLDRLMYKVFIFLIMMLKPVKNFVIVHFSR